MVPSTPFFSIIIPTYNRADLLPTAIKSVLAQSYQNWELVVVDDGSTDNTAIVVSNFKDERVRYIYQTNAERSAARNTGIDHALGRYICFLDSDDYYLPERLTQLHNELIKPGRPVAMFYTNYIIDKSGQICPSNVVYGNNVSAFESLATKVLHSQQVCISAEILQEFKYDTRFRIGEDMELWFRIAAKYPVYYLDGQNTIAVVDHEDRSVNVMRHNTGKEQLRLYAFLFTKEHSGKNIPANLKRFLLSGAYQSIARYHIYQANRTAAIVAILKSINADKQSVFFKFRLNILIKLLTFSSTNRLKQLIE